MSQQACARCIIRAIVAGAVWLLSGWPYTAQAADSSPSPQPASIAIPLTLNNPLSFSRCNEVVTTGVPIDRNTPVYDATTLALLDGQGQSLPAQVDVLARWYKPPTDTSAPIRVALVTFVAPCVPASGSASFTLTNSVVPPVITSPISAVDDGTNITVDNGALRVVISKTKYSGLESLDIKQNSQWVPAVMPSSKNGYLITRKDGSQFESQAGPTDNYSAVIESQGPLSVTILVTGRLHSDTDNNVAMKNYLKKPSQNPVSLDYFECKDRITIVQGQPHLTYVSHCRYPERRKDGEYNQGNIKVYHEEEGFDLRFQTLIGAGAGTTATFVAETPPDDWIPPAAKALGGPSVVTTPLLNPTDVAKIYQDSSGVKNWQDSNDLLWGTTFRGWQTSLNGAATASGIQARGFAELSNGTVSLTTGLRHFREYFPKAIEARGNGILRIKLFPDEFKIVDRFEGGRNRTFTIHLGARPGGLSTTALQNDAEGFERPMMLLASPTDYATSQAFGMLSIPDANNPDVYRKERLSQTVVASQIVNTSPGADNSERDYYGSAYRQDFGKIGVFDDYRGGSKNSGRFWGVCEFDKSWLLYREWFRYQDYRHFELASGTARHVADAAVYDTIEDNPIYNNAMHPDDVSAQDINEEPKSSHEWDLGLIVDYLYTGDRYALEAAQHLVQHVEWLMDPQKPGELLYSNDTREQAWPIYTKTIMCEFFGDPQDCNDAKAIAYAEFVNDVIGDAELGGTTSSTYLDWNGSANYPNKQMWLKGWQGAYGGMAIGRLAYVLRQMGQQDAGLETWLAKFLDANEEYLYTSLTKISPWTPFVFGNNPMDNWYYGRPYENGFMDKLDADWAGSPSCLVNTPGTHCIKTYNYGMFGQHYAEQFVWGYILGLPMTSIHGFQDNLQRAAEGVRWYVGTGSLADGSAPYCTAGAYSSYECEYDTGNSAQAKEWAFRLRFTDLFEAVVEGFVPGGGGPVNQPPVANAGPDQTITLSDVAMLDGTVTDDGLPNGQLTTLWSQTSGPAGGSVTFGNASAVDTTASFSIEGTYVLRLTASDGQLTAVDEVTVTVDPDAIIHTATVVATGTFGTPNAPALITVSVFYQGDKNAPVGLVLFASTKTGSTALGGNGNIVIPLDLNDPLANAWLTILPPGSQVKTVITNSIGAGTAVWNIPLKKHRGQPLFGAFKDAKFAAVALDSNAQAVAVSPAATLIITE